ncbi:MAG: hypothetical protein EOM64_05415 [Erysipelotrichia bacterium]|nr:hypothetical protein [Erysipelotrichia bacterium]
MRRNMYLLAGGPKGSRRTAEQLKEALSHCGSKHPAAAYIGTASQDDEFFMHYVERLLKKAGAESVTMVPLAGKKQNTEKAETILRGSDLIFVSGGEVEDGMKGLNRNIRALLKELLEQGTLFIGLSAGSIMLGSGWPHWDDEDHHPEDARLFDCLGFAQQIFDTHAESEGWTELKKAVELMPEGFVGYGIPSGEMAVIDDHGELTDNAGLIPCVNINGRAVLKQKDA